MFVVARRFDILGIMCKNMHFAQMNCPSFSDETVANNKKCYDNTGPWHAFVPSMCSHFQRLIFHLLERVKGHYRFTNILITFDLSNK